MNDKRDRHARVSAAFLAVRELPAGERAASVEAISDLDVRAEVASLLSYDADETALLRERPADEVPVILGASRPPPPLLGRVLGGRFEVQAAVAEGGFGWVFRGRDTHLDAPVAVKLFKPIHQPHLALEAESAFRREGRVLSELAGISPHVVVYQEMGTWSDEEGRLYPYIVMEWLDGPSLAEHCGRRAGGEAWSFDRTVALLTPVAEALAAAHERGVAHRDLKPSNVVCVGDPAAPSLKLVDFGAAKLAAERARGFDSTGGRPGVVTFRYAAPEQLSKDFGPTGPWTDVYALALLLVEVTLGRNPWAHLNQIEVMDRILAANERPTPRRLGIAVDDATEAAMEQALAVGYQSRPRDARKFWATLTRTAARMG